jgi:hypothetical protein
MKFKEYRGLLLLIFSLFALYLSTFLYDQGQAEGDGIRSFYRLWHCQTERWEYLGLREYGF